MNKRLVTAVLLIVFLVIAAGMAACGDGETATTSGAPATTAGAATTAPSTSESTTQTTATAGEVKTLQIGLITSVTGPFAAAFKAQYDALKPTQDLINSRGGFKIGNDTYQIEIVAEDDQSTTAGSLTAIERIVGKGIHFLIPPMVMPVNIAIQQTCEDNEILSFKPVGANTIELNPNLPHSMYVRSGVPYIKPFYEYISGKYPNAKRIALIYADDPGGATYDELAREAIAAHGMEIVYSELYPTGTADFYPILNKALAAKPDAIELLFGIPPWTSAVINQARELGFTGPIWGCCPMGDPNIINAMITPQYAYDIVCGSEMDVLSDQMPDIVKELRPMVEATGSPFTMDSPMPLDAIYIMIQCIEKAQSIDPKVVLAAIDEMGTFDTIWGPATWGGTDIWGKNVFGIDHVVIGPNMLSWIQDGKVGYEVLE